MPPVTVPLPAKKRMARPVCKLSLIHILRASSTNSPFSASTLVSSSCHSARSSPTSCFKRCLLYTSCEPVRQTRRSVPRPWYQVRAIRRAVHPPVASSAVSYTHLASQFDKLAVQCLDLGIKFVPFGAQFTHQLLQALSLIHILRASSTNSPFSASTLVSSSCHSARSSPTSCFKRCLLYTSCEPVRQTRRSVPRPWYQVRAIRRAVHPPVASSAVSYTHLASQFDKLAVQCLDLGIKFVPFGAQFTHQLLQALSLIHILRASSTNSPFSASTLVSSSCHSARSSPTSCFKRCLLYTSCEPVRQTRRSVPRPWYQVRAIRRAVHPPVASSAVSYTHLEVYKRQNQRQG